MACIRVLNSDAIDAALKGNTRQYLVGNLKMPQSLNHIHSEQIEIGITHYSASGHTEAPHRHRNAFEFQYVVSGTTSYLDIITGEEWTFRRGDFYVIEPGVEYAQKSGENTTILFIKIPAGNDKITVGLNPAVEEWFKAQIQGDK